MKKLILISIDGVRPDGLEKCGNPYVNELKKICAYTLNGESVNPTITFPCHFSMAHSVTPQRHGILSNTYVPQVRPVTGVFEVISQNNGRCAFVYGWEQLRDIAPPGVLNYATYIGIREKESVDTILTDECIKIIKAEKTDFTFLYLGDTDEKGGHDAGWMSDEYLRRISIAIDNVKRIIEVFGEEYSIIIMSDHGGHDRTHGTLSKEDMTIPFFFYGKDFVAGEIKDKVTLLDIAPTIVKVLGINPIKDWEGSSII